VGGYRLIKAAPRWRFWARWDARSWLPEKLRCSSFHCGVDHVALLRAADWQQQKRTSRLHWALPCRMTFVLAQCDGGEATLCPRTTSCASWCSNHWTLAQILCARNSLQAAECEVVRRSRYVRLSDMCLLLFCFTIVPDCY